MQKTVLFLTNHHITLFAFRRELIARLCEEGHRVYISAPHDEKNSFFEGLGCTMIDTPMSRRGMNPLEDMKLVAAYKKIMKQVQPDVIFSYTIKPNIYGAMASNALGMRQVCNVTGTGATFLKESLLSRVARTLYRMSLKKSYKVFFQNSGDKDYFLSHGLVKDNWDMLPGSGVNLERHSFCPLPETDEVSFIYIGRVMGVKGIDEYLECARHMRELFPNSRFYVAGFVEEEKYKKLLDQYSQMGVVEQLGFQEDISPWLRRCHCVVLPSLGGEGVPNVLLEAAATGRACICSDIPGSVDVVLDGVNGFVFRRGDAKDLICKAEEFMSLSFQEKKQMGLEGRRIVEKNFDRQIVINKYLEELEK